MMPELPVPSLATLSITTSAQWRHPMTVASRYSQAGQVVEPHPLAHRVGKRAS